MNLLKRVLSGMSAFFILLSYNTIGLVADAKETDSNSYTDIIRESSVTYNTPNIDDEITLNVTIPEVWSKNFDDWKFETDKDAVIYYKTSPVPISEDEWGSYTDFDVRQWNNGINLVDGEGYIKFWAVKTIENADKIIATDNAKRFFYDKTLPDVFRLEKVETDYNEFVIQNTDPIKDNLSGIKEAFYIVNPKNIQTLEDIHEFGTEVILDRTENGISFEIPCVKEMNKSTVMVYVIDNAGNIRHNSIEIDTYKVLSAPKLTVNGIKSDQWVNNLDDWNIYSDSVDAKIYFKTADSDLQDWGSYTDSNVEIWTDNVSVPEGDRFIHFWAAYDDADRKCEESTFEYRFDATPPNNFSIEYEHGVGHTDINKVWHAPKFIVHGSDIFDNTSGINQSRIYYIVTQNGAQGEPVELEQSNQKTNKDGTISFTLDLSNAEWLRNVYVTFYIEDKAGNKTSCPLDENEVTYDPLAPEIITDTDTLCFTRSTDDCAAPIEPLFYGSEELSNCWNSVYVRGEDYLKLTIIEDDLQKIEVTVDGEKAVTFSDDGKENTKKWECNNKTQSNGAKVYFLKLSDFGMTEDETHSLSIVAKDHQNSSKIAVLTTENGNEDVEYTIIYDPNDDGDSIIEFTSGNVQTIGDEHYYGEFFKDNITISMSDDNGIKGYSVKISGPEGFNRQTGLINISKGEDVVGTYEKEVEVTDGEGNIVKDEDGNIQTTVVAEQVTYKKPYMKASRTIAVDNTVYKYDGKYEVIVQVEDLAGNIRSVHYEFYVDTTSPNIVDEHYTCDPSILRYLSFGIFGNETVDIEIIVEDNETGCGIDKDNVFLYWGNKKIKGSASEKEGFIEFTFEKISVGGDDVPYITVMDQLGNSANYYFETDNGKLAEQNKTTDIHLVLENIKPTAEIILPKDNQYLINGEIWYPSGFDYDVIAKDSEAGLNNVSVIESIINSDGYLETKSEITEDGIIIDSDYIKFDAMSERFNNKASYRYHIEDEGNYQISIDAQDNAGNKLSDTPDNLKDLKKTIHIDKTNPEIVEFLFSDQNDSGADMERGTYGFYFTDDTKVRIFVKDDGISSGINYVTLYLKDVNGQEKSKKIYSSEDDYHIENGLEYAEFTIEKGFKGQVWALAADNVVSENPFEDGFKHTSGFRYADGNIVEDEELHKSVSGITISEDTVTNKSDSNGIPLYNNSVPLTINVQDTFSGISTIEWSIANDGSSGIITIENDGSYKSDSDLASIVENSVSTDANLITALSFRITVSSNTNGNEVYVKLTDRSGNESEAKKQYSIDTSKPHITTELSNQNPTNKMYYNTDQTVTVSITERNFNAADVKFMINGDEQIIDDWSSEGKGDDTVHTGTFTISSDGDYSYSVNFTDMAGNNGEPFIQSMFIIDKTDPILKTNFDEFKTSEEKHYFGVNSLNKTAIITIIEHNFSADDANVEVWKKEAGLEHNTKSMNLVSTYGWKDNGDTHTLEIPFKKNDDGIYLIRVSPADLASNSTASQETVVFEIDFTNPIISERNGVYAEDKAESYEFLEIYNESTGLEDNFIPSVGFSDTNFDHIEYDLTVYTPEYTNGKEIGAIKPGSDDGKITETIFSLHEFKKDGVYSVDLTAVDKAGNRSVLCRNTSVLMMNTEVLAYISNSNKNESTGWYSLQKDENTPISKRPDSFSNLDITVFAEEGSETSIVLRDENGESKDTELKADNDEDMYAVGVYNYTLPKTFFVDNYPEGTNKDLYLWVENTLNNETSHITLGWIRIDALAPTCSLPDGLKNWKSYIRSSETITLSNISESLDKSKCVVFDNGKAIPQDSFLYSDENDTLSYTLEKGWHDLSFVLADEAGNTCTIQEISSIQVGILYCLWFRIICSVIVIAVISATIVFVKKLVNK